MTSRDAGSTALWGLFCSASWTWCIGMFLPFVLLRQYGWAGFLMFAIPNVMGCAAFGYVLDRDRARALRARLGPLPRAFSIVTIAYQAYFAGWMLPEVWLVGVIGVGVAVGAMLASRSMLALAGLVSVVTAACILSECPPSLQALDTAGSLPSTDLFALGGVIALGFIACPYLDLTFHRALEESPSRHAFGVFGVAFALMLFGVASLWDGTLEGPRLTLALEVLWAVQLSFTIAAHARELLRSQSASSRSTAIAIAAIAAAAALGIAMRTWDFPVLGSGEGVYLRFLAFYGLVFPFLLVLRLRRVRQWLVWTTILASLPFYELGFIRHQPFWLLVPVGLLCVLWMAPLDNPSRKDRFDA